MYTRRFQTLITTGRLTLPVSILIAILCWISAAWTTPDMPAASYSYPLWNAFQENLIPHWAGRLISFVIYGLIGYQLIELNNLFAIIRMRASVQTAFFFLLSSACPFIHPLTAGDISTVALLVALFFLFRSYQKPHASSDLFYSFACIGTSSLLFPQFTLLAPLFWIGAYGFQSLHPKSFFASLIGWGLPYWFLLGHAYFYGQMELFHAPLKALVHFEPISFNFQFKETITLGYLFLLFIVSAAHCLIAGYEDKIRTRSYLHFLISFTFLLFVYILLQPTLFTCLLPMLLTGTSILAGHLFVLTNSRSSNIFFICMLTGLCILTIFNIWIP